MMPSKLPFFMFCMEIRVLENFSIWLLKKMFVSSFLYIPQSMVAYQPFPGGRVISFIKMFVSFMCQPIPSPFLDCSHTETYAYLTFAFLAVHTYKFFLILVGITKTIFLESKLDQEKGGLSCLSTLPSCSVSFLTSNMFTTFSLFPIFPACSQSWVCYQSIFLP